MSPLTSRIRVRDRLTWPAAIALVILASLASATWAAIPTECIVPDNGTGTADLPPDGCSYVGLSPMMITNGLPSGSTIRCYAEFQNFHNTDLVDGGLLGGQVQYSWGDLFLEMHGTGALSGFNRLFVLGNVPWEAHSAPRTPWADIQTFNHMINGMGRQQVGGDPDFDLLRVTAGNGNGLPGGGQTTLSSVAGGNWAVDSFFDITYRIDFVGHAGSMLGGMSGSTTGTVRLQSGTSDPVDTESESWGSLKALYR